ncbi:5-(carboxyamino)imidazole ribonucleotide synthase [Ancylothrix sp. C2]|nr:5-(carboxyamino)imidazole ribonucleotide synthase [Ancylothrix sp. D3o]
MMAGAAQKLNIELFIQTPKNTDPAVSIATNSIFAPIDDANATAQIAGLCDVITFENEFVNLEALNQLAQTGTLFRPSLNTLEPILDKYHQRCFMRDIGLPVPQFLSWDSPTTPQPLSYPLVMKARRHGYDGQGTIILKNPQDLETTWKSWGCPSVLLEEFIPFEQELAIIAARFPNGEIAIYPIVETQQENQVCRRVIAPATLTAEKTTEIEQIARTLLENLQAIGIFGIELFLTKQGKVLVNEVAPRTHNSGHFSLDACETSQFEQHLRAVCGLAPGQTTLNSAGAVMVNLLGYETCQNSYLEKRQRIADIPNAYLHWYGKTESRPGRKLGHVTVLLNSEPSELRQQALEISHQIESIWYP